MSVSHEPPSSDKPTAAPSSSEAVAPKPQLTLINGSSEPDAWKKKLLRSGGKKGLGPVRKVLRNAAIPLQHAPEFHNALRYNASALTVMLERSPPWERDVENWQPRVWSDNDDRHYTMWLEERGIDLKMGSVYEAVQAVSRERSYHPIKEYLAGLVWDGVPRVGKWLSTYLGAEATVLHEAVGLRWLISGVARVLRPGCKADCMLLLEGQQGAGKSTAVMILAGEWFTDEIRDVGSRDTSMSIAGKWIIEFGELEAFKGASLEKLKAFLSRSVDRFRPPWGRATIDSPRQCVFVGTTNNDETLHDATGNRRFWPVACGRVDVEALRRDRDQLWAEAKHLFEQGHPWWVDSKELQDLAAKATEERSEVDVLEDDVAAYVDKREEVTIRGILEDLLELDLAKVTRHDQTRVSNILKRLGWKRQTSWRGETRGMKVFRRKLPTEDGELPT